MERRQEVAVWRLRGGVEEGGNIKEGMGQRICGGRRESMG